MHVEDARAPPLQIVTRPRGLEDEEDRTIEEADPLQLYERQRDEPRFRGGDREVDVRRKKWRFLGIERIWDRGTNVSKW